jgi:hypothetical protein
MFGLSSLETLERWEGRRSRVAVLCNETWNKSIVETVSPDVAQNTAARRRRDGCSEKLEIFTFDIRIGTNGSTTVLCRECSLHKSRVNEDIPIDARGREADEGAQTDEKGVAGIGINQIGTRRRANDAAARCDQVGQKNGEIL